MGRRMNRGRPRTRPPVRRVTLELDEALLAAIEVAGGTNPLRAIVEAGLQLWLDQNQTPTADLNRMASEHKQRQQP